MRSRQGQVGTEPVEGLLAQTGTFLVVEHTRVLALAGGRQGGGPGGVEAVPGLQILGQPGIEELPARQPLL